MALEDTTSPGKLGAYKLIQGEEVPPLTKSEVVQLRKMLVDDDHATWLRKQVKVFVPWIATVVASGYGLVLWVSKHVNWNSGN